MGRWPAGAQERLEHAAIDLFVEHGYDRTTVAEIASRAGLTERTFYNHFADKREVLFPGQDRFNADIVEALGAAPSDQRPLDMIVEALAATVDWFDQRREAALRRRRILDAHRELQERELIKWADLSTAIAGALQARGISHHRAVMTATAAVTAYRLASASWLADPERRGLGTHLHSTVDELRRSAAHW